MNPQIGRPDFDLFSLPFLPELAAESAKRGKCPYAGDPARLATYATEER
jgi:hypothetical protein